MKEVLSDNLAERYTKTVRKWREGYENFKEIGSGEDSILQHILHSLLENS